MKVTKLKKENIEHFFTLYKQIVTESFEEWTNESKNRWLTNDYSPKFWTKLLEENKCPVFLIEKNNQYIGLAAIEDIDYGVAYLGWIGVLKTHQRQGLSNILMNTVIDWCKQQQNIHKIELETQILKLQPYYEKYGFVLEGVRKKSWQKLDNYMFGKVL